MVTMRLKEKETKQTELRTVGHENMTLEHSMAVGRSGVWAASRLEVNHLSKGDSYHEKN